MNRKQEFTQQLEEQLGEWSDEIDRLREQAHTDDEISKVKHLQTVDQLRAQQEIARHKLNNLQKADGEDWQNLKSGVEIAWKNLESAIGSAADR